MSAKALIEQRLKAIGAPKDSRFNNNEPLFMQWDESLTKFSNAIERYYIDNKQNKEEYAKKLLILKEIEEYLANHVFDRRINGIIYDIKGVVPFGSSASGLGMKGGDLDLIVCVHPPLGRRRNDKIKERTNDILSVIFQKIISREMLGHRTFKDMEHRVHARVPIVTGTVDGIDLDISISMTYLVCAQYLSSKYIDGYEKYDRRFVLLAAFVKYWQKSMKTDRNEKYYKTVFPNSCSTVLLVVFFMRYYGLLPNITVKHQDRIGEASLTWAMVNQGENGTFGLPSKEVEAWKKSNTCHVSVGTLFLLFLDFYANVVDLKRYKLVIETGKLHAKGRKKPDQVVIEDVIDKQNPAASVTEVGMYIHCLEKAMSTVKETEVKFILDTLTGEPLRNITEYSKKQISQMRTVGLHRGAKPSKFK